jgi:hypothetical protein
MAGGMSRWPRLIGQDQAVDTLRADDTPSKGMRAKADRSQARREVALDELEQVKRQAALDLQDAQADIDARVAAGSLSLEDAATELERLHRLSADLVEDALRRAGIKANEQTGPKPKKRARRRTGDTP